MTRLVRLDADPPPCLPPENGRLPPERGGGDLPDGHPVRPRRGPAFGEGVSRLVAAKSRDRGKPIPLLLSGPEEVGRWARRIPEGADRLMRRFWPGALTLVLPAAPASPCGDHGGETLVGLRVPDHPVRRRWRRGCPDRGSRRNVRRTGGDPGSGIARRDRSEFAAKRIGFFGTEAGGANAGVRPWSG